MITAALMLTAQTEAMASSTRVTFQIPLVMTSYHVPTGTSAILCRILQNSQGNIQSKGGYAMNFSSSRNNAHQTISITVSARSGQTFQKGDNWRCEFTGKIATDSKLDRSRSTVLVQGTL